MWAANLNQVYVNKPQGDRFSSWVIFLRHGGESNKESVIREKHERIDKLLSEQNVCYTEITTRSGKSDVYDRFGIRNKQHPLFLILNKPPLEYSKKDSFIVIEWGKWPDNDELKDNVMALVNFISDEEFQKQLTKAKDVRAWRKLLKLGKDYGLPVAGIIVSAL